MTRKDYRKIAKIISDNADTKTMAIDGGVLVLKLAEILQEDNLKFNRTKFFDACMVNMEDV
jgi:hypothetical protein